MSHRSTRVFDLTPLKVLGALNLSSAKFERVSVERLEATLRGCSMVPFYAQRMRDAGVEPNEVPRMKNALDVLRALPPVSKRELQDAGDSVVANGRIDPSWRSSMSSGSTGEPLRVYYDRPAWMTLKYLVKYRARAACGMRPYHRAALLDAIALGDEGGSLLERLGRVRRISIFRRREEIVERLTEFAPHWVYGLPSVLADAAPVLQSQTPALRPRALFTSGEILLPSTRAFLQETYGCPVLDVYGSSETKEIAWECVEGSMHVNADVVRVEVLDDGDQPVPGGTEGHIVATVTVNSAMPLIRYRTGDRGSLLGGQCRCGLCLPMFGVVTGREVDILEMDGSRRVSSYAITCALERIAALRRYQVTQVGRTELRVRALVSPGAPHEPTTCAIRSALEEAVGLPLTVAVEFIDRIHPTTGLKFKVVEALRDD